MSYFSQLKGFDNVFDSTLNNDIQDGIIEYFDWALLEKGNYFNADLGEESPEGTDYSKLRISSHDQFASGEAWEGFRSNWVWQSGISYSPAPIVGSNHAKPGISGVYVDSTFYDTATTTGEYSHFIDYFNGRVIFNTAIPTGSTVQVEHSYKWINVVYSNNIPWLREIQLDSHQPTSSFYDTENGAWNIPPEARVQLPAIAVEIAPRRSFTGYGLGGGQWVYTDVIFHCLAEDEQTRDKLVDIVSLQNDKTIHLFNSNTINDNADFPLDFNGTPVSGALRYPDLVEAYNGGKLTFTNASVSKLTVVGSNVYGGIVTLTTEGVKSNI